MHCSAPGHDSRVWRTPDALHLDLRGLDPPEPLVTVLRMIDQGEVDSILIAHFDREPIFLYPELDDRGWSHAVVPSECGFCEDGITLRIARYAA
jgi:hypothetical protein